MIWFETRGLVETVQMLNYLGDNFTTVLDKGMDQWSSSTADALKQKGYPSAPSGSRYTRTGLLGESFYSHKLGPLTYAFGNSAPYSRYVIDPEWQAWMHRGRWWVITDVLEEEIPRLADPLFDAVAVVWSG